jgi:uncharacterized membrane protein
LQKYVQSRLDNCERGNTRFLDATKRFSEDIVLKSVATNANSKLGSVNGDVSGMGRSKAVSVTGGSVKSKGSIGDRLLTDFDDDPDPDQQVLVKLQNGGLGNGEQEVPMNDEGEVVSEKLTMAQRLQRQVEQMRALKKIDGMTSSKLNGSSSKGQMILGTLKDTADEVVFYK